MQVTIEDVQAQRGSTAQFQAVIEGNPQPTVTWYRVGTGTVWGAGPGECVAVPPDSKALTGGWDRLPCRGPQVGLMSTRLCPQDDAQLVDGARLSQQQEGITYSLVLRDVAQDDAGVYTCLALNAGGQVLCKAELVVHGGESGDPSQNPSVCSLRARGGVCGLSWAPAQGCYTCGKWTSVPTPTAFRSLTAGDSEPDSEKQSYRRKLHSFYEVKEEIGRYGPITQTQEPLPRPRSSTPSPRLPDSLPRVPAPQPRLPESLPLSPSSQPRLPESLPLSPASLSHYPEPRPSAPLP